MHIHWIFTDVEREMINKLVVDTCEIFFSSRQNRLMQWIVKPEERTKRTVAEKLEPQIN